MRLPLILSAVLVAAALIAAPASAQQMREFTAGGHTTMIPVDPQRIVALHDIGITVPLIELGVMPVGSSGRVAPDGSFYIRSGMSLVKTDYSNSSIKYVANGDLEAIAALQPDLIMTNSDDALALLALIAPTIVLNRADNPGLAQLKLIADATGKLAIYETLEARFLNEMAILRSTLPDAENMTVSLLQATDGSIGAQFFAERGALGYVLDELGFRMPAIVEEAGQAVTVSAERLRELDGDFIIDTYRKDFGLGPADARAALAEVLPNWCEFLHACRNHQYFAVPRDEALALSFGALDLMMMAITVGIAGRDYVPLTAE